MSDKENSDGNGGDKPQLFIGSTFNRFMVGMVQVAGAPRIRVLGYRYILQSGGLSRADALNLAAHLVSLADLSAEGQAEHGDFLALLRAIEEA